MARGVPADGTPAEYEEHFIPPAPPPLPKLDPMAKGAWVALFGGPDGIRDYRDRIAQLSSVAGVRSIEPAIYNTVLLSCGGRAGSSHGYCRCHC